MESTILDYIEPLYRFCLKRLSCRQEAEDLTQEILLCILDGMRNQNIQNLNGYVWHVAHNRYARKIDNRNKRCEVLYGDNYFENIMETAYLEDNLLLNEEHQAVFCALHSLSYLYRDILVDYYVHNLNTSEIANKHNTSIDTIKWRLHIGKERIKGRLDTMNKTYEKIKMHIMCNGSFGPNQYLCNQIYKAIALDCYEKPVTIEEISLSTGIPTLYLDEALEWMTYGDAIEKAGNKYQTNFIIAFQNDNLKMQRALEPAASEIAEKVWEVITDQLDSVQKLGFYGSKFPVQKLGYILVPILLRGASDKLKRESKELNPGTRPLRKDGGNGWFIVTEGIETIDEHFAGCNQYYTKPHDEHGFVTYYWLGHLFNDELNVFFHELEDSMPGFDSSGHYLSDNEEKIAKLVKFNIIEKCADGYQCKLPIITREQNEKLFSLFEPFYDDITGLIKSWIYTLYNEYMRFVPDRLKNQIAGNVDSYSFNVVAFIILELQKQGLLRIPQNDEIFTDNAFYTRKSIMIS